MARRHKHWYCVTFTRTHLDEYGDARPSNAVCALLMPFERPDAAAVRRWADQRTNGESDMRVLLVEPVRDSDESEGQNARALPECRAYSRRTA